MKYRGPADSIVSQVRQRFPDVLIDWRLERWSAEDGTIILECSDNAASVSGFLAGMREGGMVVEKAYAKRLGPKTFVVAQWRMS